MNLIKTFLKFKPKTRSNFEYLSSNSIYVSFSKSFHTIIFETDVIHDLTNRAINLKSKKVS